MLKKRAKPVAVIALCEVAYSRAVNVDEEAGVLRNVKVLGYDSGNGRTYDPAAVSKARRLYEGINVNLDHSRNVHATRGVAERFGWLESVREASDGLYADLHYLKAHPQAGAIVEAARRRPELVGLSHSAEGREVTRNGRRFVEEITRVRSVDLVSDPATTKSLFESEGRRVTKTLREIMAGGRWAALLEMDGMDDAMPVDVPAEAGADEQIKAAFRTMVMAAFDDDSLDSSATLAKIKTILKAQEKIMAKDDSADAADKADANDSEPTTESRQQSPTAAVLFECIGALEQAGIAATEIRVKALSAVDKADRQALVESWTKPAATAATPKPRSGAPLQEQRTTAYQPPKDVPEFISRMRG